MNFTQPSFAVCF